MKENTKSIIVATWVGIIVNGLLALLKGVGGFLSGSKALLADALHSASDIVGSVVVLFAVKIANKPPDEEHPYGHGKAENIASIIVALLLIVVGVEISISSIKVFFGEAPQAPGKIALVIIIISIIVKEALFQYKYKLGKKYSSTALISEAWHHRSDSLSSGAALLGIGSAILGEMFHITVLVYGDAVAGIIVSLIVIKVGYSLAKESSLVIMEKVLDEDDSKMYIDTVLSIDGVEEIDQIHVRTHGSYAIIDIKVSVDRKITVEQGHEIAKNVKTTLMEKHKEIEDVLVHINPY
ncbi:cation diffusion facilitator family transporter [Virgibacillus sp. W0181]|uniref:cation diffusion facilitator family transporter n=1 Tax=Virgibacillus sp. W0181 TaxID=3391581 RepID=UPI003F44A54B